MSFSRRIAVQSAALDLGVLLARISAAQSASPTAQAHFRLMTGHIVRDANPYVALFAGAASESACGSGSFSAVFSSRKPN